MNKLIKLGFNTAFVTLFLIWVGGSFWYLLKDYPIHFQSIGSFGVAVCVLFFGIRIVQTTRSASQANSDIIETLTLSLSQLNHSSAILMKGFEYQIKYGAARYNENRYSEELAEIEVLRSQIVSEMEGTVDEGIQLSKRIETLLDKVRRKSDKENRKIQALTILQIFPVIVATLQWGYGNVFVEYIHTF